MSQELNGYFLRERLPTITMSASGVVSTAPATVDIVSNIGVTASAASLAFTLPNPTDTRSGRSVVVTNTGTNAFAMYGQTIQAGQYSDFIWGAEDTAWHAQADNGGSAWDNPDGTPATQASGAINYMDGNVGIGTNTPAVLLHTFKAGGNVVRIEANAVFAGTQSNLPTAKFFSGAQDFGGPSRYNIVNNITGAEAFTVNAVTSNVGIKRLEALNTLHVGPAFVPNTGGVRLPITSTSAAQTGQPIGVDANGDIIRLTATSFDATVSFSTTTPTAGGVVFTPNTPASTTVLYVSAVDGSQWTYNGTTYVTQPASADWKTAGNSGSVQATNFIGTTDNVGLSFRTNNVIRQTITNDGNIGIGTTTANAPLQFANTTSNRKIVLLDAFNNDNQFYGFGVNPTILRYQVNAIQANHVFYAAASATSSNELMRIQGDGKVGVGTGTPANKFHVFSTGYNPSANDLGALKVEGSYGGGLIFAEASNRSAIWSNSGLDLSFGTGGSAAGAPERMIITRTGNVGIGTAGPAAKLHVIGNIIASGTITPSDKRLKSNIKDVVYGLKDLLKLTAVSYTKKFSLDKAEKGEGSEFGFIAQDLQKVMPELVTEITDKDKTLAVNYTSLIPVLVKAIQEQQLQIEALKAKAK